MGAVASLLRWEPEGFKMDDLPVDIISNILARLPAPYLKNHGRFVCKTWANIIRDPEFLKCHALVQLDMINKEKIKAAKLEKMLEGKEIVARCSGFLLVQSKSNKLHLSVVNSATRQFIDLPPLPRVMFHGCVGYVESTGEIKVICHFLVRLGVLTVGFDTAWRVIDVGPDVPICCFTCHALFVALDGVLFYWFIWYPERAMRLYAVDLVNESFHHVKLPQPWVVRLISTGKSIYVPEDKFESPAPVTTAWELKDYTKSRWKKREFVGFQHPPPARSKFYDWTEH